MLQNAGTEIAGEKLVNSLYICIIFCVECQKEGRYVKATVVDHIVPHRGDPKLFWDQSNWQLLCKHHHDVKTMTEDRYQEYRY